MRSIILLSLSRGFPEKKETSGQSLRYWTIPNSGWLEDSFGLFRLNLIFNAVDQDRWADFETLVESRGAHTIAGAWFGERATVTI